MMQQPNYKLTVNDFDGLLRSSFECELEKNNFSDVTLISGDEKFIKGNKLILATFSDFFRRIFLQTSIKENVVLFVKGVNYQELVVLFKFMYNGAVDIDENDIEPVLTAAKELQIKGFYETSQQAEKPELNATLETGDDNVINDVATTVATNDEASNEEPLTEESIKAFDFTTIVPNDDRRPKIKKTPLKKRQVKVKSESETYDDQRTKGDMYVESFKVRNKPFKCVVCALSYSSQGALLNHKRGKHEGVMYNCEIRDCNFAASQAGNLRTHIMNKHNDL